MNTTPYECPHCGPDGEVFSTLPVRCRVSSTGLLKPVTLTKEGRLVSVAGVAAWCRVCTNEFVLG